MSRVKGADLALGATVVAAALVTGAAASGWTPISKPDNTVSQAQQRARTVTPSATTTPTTASSTPAPALTPAPLPRLDPDRPGVIGVLGDAISNQTHEWVNVLGAMLGERRRTLVQRVNQTDQSAYNDPIRYGDDDPELQIWNGSVVGASPEVTGERVKQLLPQAPGLVIVSVGRSVDGSAVARQLNATREAVQRAYPQARMIVVLQPAETGGTTKQAELDAVKGWATSQGLPVIDVAAAFASAPATPRLQEADQDSSITTAGHALWAATVYQALMGTAAPAVAADQTPSRPTDPAPQPTSETTARDEGHQETVESAPTRTSRPTATRTRWPARPAPRPTARPTSDSGQSEQSQAPQQGEPSATSTGG